MISSYVLSNIVFLFAFIVLTIDIIIIFLLWWRTFENHILTIVIKKTKFASKNKINVSSLFLKSISSVFSIVKRGNIKIFAQTFFQFLFFIFLFIFLFLTRHEDSWEKPFYYPAWWIVGFWFLRFSYLIYFILKRFFRVNKLKK
ncbi:Uncharacterised protein [Mycoplasmopsis citelli]|uniref:Uncharacterized protein n=1 Tax=Mycoplasmopsis citelli TaxID=171281 RepID=A0A449B236_9BACT|nr:Uncharacterised protein [Mycoplasmopsis citelli]